MKRITLLFLALANIYYGISQVMRSQFKSTIDSVVRNAAESFMKDTSRVGVSIGVYKDKKSFAYNFGYTEKNKIHEPTNRTIYEIGSITKTFTGILLAQAVFDKRVNINDDIRKYLNESYPNLQYSGQPIKLYELINHTSGLPFLLPERPDIFRHSQDSIYYFVIEIQSHYTKENFLKDLHYVKLDTVPGTKFSYSNAGAQLLSFILENIYKESFENLVEKYITIPNDMPNTKLSYSETEEEKFAKGYNGKGYLMPYNSTMIGAAGKINSTIPDMLNYIKFNLNENNAVIKLSHTTTFGNIDNFAIGLNWQMNKTPDGHRRIWQSGGSFGFSSYCVIYPELNIGIVLLSNEADRTAQGGLEEAAKVIFEAIKD
jgi:serine-type D-Ala-D-Ala carboxypeptidase/endopeptidase